MVYDKAFEKIKKDDRLGGNPIPDPLRFSYFSSEKSKLFKEIDKKIKDGSYEVRPLLDIDVPKSNFTIRPMARPEIQDWIVYQAIIDKIAPRIVKQLSERSYSLLNFREEPPKRKTQAWLKFDEKSREYYESGLIYVVVTDISSFFENINLQELLKKLINYIERGDKDTKKVINFLFVKLLNQWSYGRVKKFGLPQGPSASLFLGDVFLDNVDSELEEVEGYIRYMDDMRIFCKDEKSAKKALIKLIKSLRKYKLNINAKKTRILVGKKVSRKLFDPKKPQLDAIQSAFDSRDTPKIQAVIKILVDDVFQGGFQEDNSFGQRHIRFSLLKLEALKTSGIKFDEELVIDLILSNFVNMPHHADMFCRFLASFLDNKRVSKFLVDFLSSDDNLYEWQELHVLRSMLEIKFKPGRGVVEMARQRFKDKNIHWANRALYCLLVGKYGKAQERELITDEFDSADNDELRRNMILAVQDLGDASRNDFYRRARESMWPENYIDYIKGLKRSMYFRPYEKIKLGDLKKLEIVSYPY